MIRLHFNMILILIYVLWIEHQTFLFNKTWTVLTYKEETGIYSCVCIFLPCNWKHILVVLVSIASFIPERQRYLLHVWSGIQGHILHAFINVTCSNASCLLSFEGEICKTCNIFLHFIKYQRAIKYTLHCMLQN